MDEREDTLRDDEYEAMLDELDRERRADWGAGEWERELEGRALMNLNDLPAP